MDKNDFKKAAADVFKGKTLKVVNEQIDNFYTMENQTFKNVKYAVGKDVVLTPDTYLHGFGDDLKVFDLFADRGLINKDYEYGATNHFTHHTVSLWHIRKKIKLADYVVNYSGMSVKYEDKFEMVPYGQLDTFVEKMRNVHHWLWEAESSMEIRFMPSLARDKNQLAFIINGRDKCLQPYFANDIINKNFDFEIAKDFLNERGKQRGADGIRNDPGIQRIGYVVFGIPKTLFEGVLVGRKYEKNKKVLKHIKEKLPQCYICNLDGKVIVE